MEIQTLHTYVGHFFLSYTTNSNKWIWRVIKKVHYGKIFLCPSKWPFCNAFTMTNISQTEWLSSAWSIPHTIFLTVLRKQEYDVMASSTMHPIETCPMPLLVIYLSYKWGVEWELNWMWTFIIPTSTWFKLSKAMSPFVHNNNVTSMWLFHFHAQF